MRAKSIPFPSLEALQRARKTFEANEPRDLFYRAATELVALAIDQATSLSVAEALAVLLQTWNSSYYRFHGKFDDNHFHELEYVLQKHNVTLMLLRQRTLQSMSQEDEATIASLFSDFEHLLGSVGAAKGLHLLAPTFFPLWDREIAAAYGTGLRKRGANAERYVCFMRHTKAQCEALGSSAVLVGNPLKALDEYNYCRFSRKWLKAVDEA